MNKKRNSVILALSAALLVLVFTNIISKNELIHKNKEIELLENTHLELINEITVLNMKTHSLDVFEVYDEIDITDNKVSIPAYNKPTYISLSRFDIDSVEKYNSDFYEISIKKYLPNWMISVDIEKLQFIDELAYVNKNSSLKLNTDSDSSVTCDLLEGTPILVKYKFEDMVYVESQIRWDTNTIYSGWIKTGFIDFNVVSNKDYEYKYFFIPKGTFVAFGSTSISLEKGQWGLLVAQSESDYSLAVKGAGIYQIKKNVLFLE